MKNWKRRIAVIVIALVVLLAGAAVWYINDYYRADLEAAALAGEMEQDSGNLYLEGSTETGFIIYPGGKVEEHAYAPLAAMLHEAGHTVYIVKMPLHLGIFGTAKADPIIAANTQIQDWYLIGHSLGGTAASMYADDEKATQNDKLTGIIFLGSYPYRDLSRSGITVVSITASRDHVLNQQKYLESLPYFPEDTLFHEIQAGNHAGFGSYGPQKGDGEASITSVDQQREAADVILESILITE